MAVNPPLGGDATLRRAMRAGGVVQRAIATRVTGAGVSRAGLRRTFSIRCRRR